MRQDFHLHTLVSDGALDPTEVLRHAAARGITHAAVTDHDALGAYFWNDGAVFSAARDLGVELTVGIELDAEWRGREVHLLGFSMALDAPGLVGHIASVREARHERARREIGIVNELLGPGTIGEEEVFAPGRETLMKPHFIHPLLHKGLFETYEDANAWYRQNIKAGIRVPKPSLAEAVRLVRDAGGWTCLAHPGYYQKDGVDVLASLMRLKAEGLEGVETDYPYHACSPHLFSPEEERGFIESLRAGAQRLGLRTTRGSDCHTAGDFEKVYGSG